MCEPREARPRPRATRCLPTLQGARYRSLSPHGRLSVGRTVWTNFTDPTRGGFSPRQYRRGRSTSVEARIRPIPACSARLRDRASTSTGYCARDWQDRHESFRLLRSKAGSNLRDDQRADQENRFQVTFGSSVGPEKSPWFPRSSVFVRLEASGFRAAPLGALVSRLPSPVYRP
jgi:hypothetical protein